MPDFVLIEGCAICAAYGEGACEFGASGPCPDTLPTPYTGSTALVPMRIEETFIPSVFAWHARAMDRAARGLWRGVAQALRQPLRRSFRGPPPPGKDPGLYPRLYKAGLELRRA